MTGFFYTVPSKWETNFRWINRHKDTKTLIFYFKLSYNLTSCSIFSKVICFFSFLLFNIVFKYLMFSLFPSVVITAIPVGDILLSLSHLHDQIKEQIPSCLFILDTDPLNEYCVCVMITRTWVMYSNICNNQQNITDFFSFYGKNKGKKCNLFQVHMINKNVLKSDSGLFLKIVKITLCSIWHVKIFHVDLSCVSYFNLWLYQRPKFV